MLAAAAALALGLGACAGGSQQVTRQPEPLAESQDVAALLRLADGLREQGQLTTAIALYQRAAVASGDAAELVLLGRALAEAGADELAAGAFRRALSREPENPRRAPRPGHGLSVAR